MTDPISSPQDPKLDALCDTLRAMGPKLDRTGQWPQAQLELLGTHGVYRWFLPAQQGGLGWSSPQTLLGLFKLSAACLTTTFILTQRVGACRRIAASPNQALHQKILPALLGPEYFVTVGISQLTTSRQHLSKPAMAATRVSGGYQLSGVCPWVTGGAFAKYIVVGAVLPNAQQLLALVPTDQPGVEPADPMALTALGATHTGAVHLKAVFVPEDHVLEGPKSSVTGAGAGGLGTSALALGLACAAIDHVKDHAQRGQSSLTPLGQTLTQRLQTQLERMQALAAQDHTADQRAALRVAANTLCTDATTAAMLAARGAGFMAGRDPGRWCRESLFFLVWSAPPEVTQAHIEALGSREASKP